MYDWINDLTKQVASKYYKVLDTPVALSCFLLLKYGEYDQLLSKGVNPFDYNEPLSFRKDNAAVAVLSKIHNPDRESESFADLHAEALKAEAWAEASCAVTNKRLRYNVPPADVVRTMNLAQDIIAEILGKPPSFEELVRNMRFGPGKSTATTGLDTTIVAKVSNSFDTQSKNALDMAYAVQNQPMLDPHVRHSLDFCGPLCGPRLTDILDHSVFTSVAKKATANRGIVIQVHTAMLGQKSIGTILRQKAKRSRFKIDLDYLADTNKIWAELATTQRFNHYVTVDLKSASSTIAHETIFKMFPLTWALLLDRWRDDITDYDGTLHVNQKFSAMGNGYTFEMESILFFALAKASMILAGYPESFCSSFGDDIIVVKDALTFLNPIMEYLGFTQNTEKTFVSGPFRESCGADYFSGVNVRPIYIRRPIHDVKDLVRFANRIRGFGMRLYDNLYSDKQLLPVWRFVVDKIRKLDKRVGYGPAELGDTVVWAKPDECDLAKPRFRHSQWFFAAIRNNKQSRRSKPKDNTLRAWYLQRCWDYGEPEWESPLRPPYNVGIKAEIRFLARVFDGLNMSTTLPAFTRGSTDSYIIKASASESYGHVPAFI